MSRSFIISCKFYVPDYLLPHPIWSEEEVKSVEIKHTEPRGISDRLAYIAVQIMRKTFDLASGYTIGKHFQTLDERSVLVRCIFLETVAGMVELMQSNPILQTTLQLTIY